MRVFLLSTALAGCLMSLAGAAARADQTLFDFGPTFEIAKVATTDVTVTPIKLPVGAVLLVASRHDQPWPGIALPAPGGHWDLSAFEYLAVAVRNTGANAVQVACRVDNPGADGVNNCNTSNIDLAPGATGTLKVPFQRGGNSALKGKLFGMRGYPVEMAASGTIDPANVTQLIIFVPKPDADHQFEISHIHAGGTYHAPPPVDPQTFFPFIDTFGQYIHRDWPGKLHNVTELAVRRQTEAQELGAQPSPADWDKWGGWAAGPTRKATGFFRAEKYGGKWWLVDPDGKLFWSNGMDCVGEVDQTPVDERTGWFQDFPGTQPAFQELNGKAYALHGYYAGKTPATFNFGAANLTRKYGATWPTASADIAHRRLRSWGINTIGNWSSGAITGLRRTPYVATVGFAGKLLEGSEGYWGKFRDVFDPSFGRDIVASMMGQKGKAAGDPWCLGFFVDNEISWGDDVSLAIAALQSPLEQVAKQVFIADLKAKYGTVEKLNAAWGTGHASWAALLASRTAPERKLAGADLKAFYSKTAEIYFKTIRDAVHEAAPGQLYLGCRFASVNELAARAAAKYCDVVSYNLYQTSVADFKFNGGADVPLIIGEFHFGALDRGMFHTGLVPTENQADRARHYRDYVRGALRHPNFVGAHWFKYMDEPTTGRVYDEENYQIGFLDVTDTPYPETVAASREVGANLYRYRMGDKVPEAAEPTNPKPNAAQPLAPTAASYPETIKNGVVEFSTYNAPFDPHADIVDFAAVMKRHPKARKFKAQWGYTVLGGYGRGETIYDRESQTLRTHSFNGGVGNLGNYTEDYLYSNVTDDVIYTLVTMPNREFDGLIAVGCKRIGKSWLEPYKK